ncbi:E3 ubiquitin-protein ligase MARCH3-like [Acipenser oxyrinchus oxyrinchus]|uniref:RING-type E3 ubiquitin transferase n=1 Tax=Acipenser oxyrinchus oxyrinchus TaxID=40147 RepID=A0AAD8CV21_ACIOX|nr:E3 ubiquitin-protein ligase MARCH3-like [Acipenser oxyrinchus oxyrinchus]
MAPCVATMDTEETHGVWSSRLPTLGTAMQEIPSAASSEDVQSAHCVQEVPDCGTPIQSAVTSISTYSLCKEEPFCRICHEGSNNGDLLSPCECSGSLAMVHRSCLEHWLTASNTSHCELCRFEFALERLPKPLSEWLESPAMLHQRRTLCGDAICLMFITPLASLSGWLCVQGAMDLYYSNSMEAIGLIVLTLALFTIYLFWTIVSLRYHIHLFSKWKKTNQNVRLLIPRPATLPCSQQHPLLVENSSKDKTKETVV